MKFSIKSFTLVETLLIIGILVVLTVLAVPVFRVFQKESDLNNTSEEIINTLRLAQNKTLASEGNSSWGVYFSTLTDPHQYVLFKGNNYISRDAFFDEIHKLPKSVEIYEIDLLGGGQEVVFARVLGTASQPGEISIRLKDSPTKTKTIYIENSGQIILNSPLIPANGRIKDSRHVHFDYARQIAASDEILKLTFTYNASTITYDIVISNNLKDGQIYWEDEVDVGGEIQKLKIHTHRLNEFISPKTIFCIHRDKHSNSQALKIEISGDASGDLIRYDADGQTAKGNSIYVSEPNWQ